MQITGWFKRSGAIPWIALFLAVNLICPLSGGTNADSRFALLAALAEDHSARIDPYRDKTSDWARAPDGHFYSNKAPGPALLAAPLYLLIDKIGTWGAPAREERDAWRWGHKGRLLKWLSWAVQILPYVCLLAAAGYELASRRGSDVAFLALTLGSTIAYLFNSFVGHGFTAAAVLAFALALLADRPLLAGLGLGMAVLGDYGSLALLPGAAWALASRWKRWLLPFAAGAAAPAGAWLAYHAWCFGNPFLPASRFQNPLFVDRLESRSLWGIFTLPSPEIAVKLLVGAERGLLWTNPWILALLSSITFAALFPSEGKRSALARFAVGGGAGLFLMNAGFGGWHGGLIAGPRYLASVFPAWALWVGLEWPRLAPRRRTLVLTGLGVSVAVTALVFSGGLSAPVEPLWPFLLRRTQSWTSIARLTALFAGGLSLFGFLKKRKPRLIGLTGGVASGKSTVAAILRQKGFAVIDLDAIGRKLVEERADLPARIAEIVGPTVLNAGALDRRKLRDHLFENAADRARIERLLHPLIWDRFETEAAAARRAGHERVICEAALLVEAKLTDRFDELVVVTAPESARIDRLKKRDGIDDSLARKILASQVSEDERRKAATVLVENDGGEELLKKKVDALAKKWR